MRRKDESTRRPSGKATLKPLSSRRAPALPSTRYLFFGGKWVADKAIPGNRPYCHECGYDLTNAAGNVCTECGTPFKPAEMSSAS